MVTNERVISINLTFDQQYSDTARKTPGPPKILPDINIEPASLTSYCKRGFLRNIISKKTLLFTLCGKAHALV